ncbi:MAG: hypothetical protein ACOCTU_00940 [Bacteroidota bacterium]
MLFKKLFFPLILGSFLLSAHNADSQGLAAYTDFRNHFHVFDNGNFRQLEHLPVINYKVGKWCVAYRNNNGALMVYHDGQKKELSKVVREYEVTEGLLVYTYNNNLFVYNGREKKFLSMNAPYYKAKGDLVAYYDEIDKMFKVYYKGQVFDVESALSTPSVNNFQVGDNIMSYVDPNGYLNAFFEGNTRRLMLMQGQPIHNADKNIVAYYDVSRSVFGLYHISGQRELGYFRPESFKTSDNRVVYVENTGNFMVYENDEIRTLSTNTPEFYMVHDSILIYEEQNHFKVYYDGRVYTLENFIPEQIKYGVNTLAYLNQRSHLRVFRHGKVETISYAPVNSFEVYWDVVWFNVGVNSNKVYYKGRVY